MKIEAKSPDEYIQRCPDSHKEALRILRQIIQRNLPQGFSEVISYGMIGYVVPHSIYPSGYHCNMALPLPFIHIASQKHFIGLYHMGIYADQSVCNWFKEAYAQSVPSKLEIGKSCIRFKKPDEIPYELVGQLCQKFTVQEWIDLYESSNGK